MPRGRKAKSQEAVQQPKQKKVRQRLVRNDRVSFRKAQGWKVIKPHCEKKQIEYSDLTLMEKEV